MLNALTLFHTTWLDWTFPEHYNQPALSSSRCTLLRVSLKSVPATIQRFRTNNSLHLWKGKSWRAWALIIYLFLICINQCHPAAAVAPGVPAAGRYSQPLQNVGWIPIWPRSREASEGLEVSHDDIVKRVRAEREPFMPPLHKRAFLLTDGNGITHSSLRYDVVLRVTVGSQEMLL